MSCYSGPKITSANLVFHVDFANRKSVSGNNLIDLMSRKIPVTLVNPGNNTLSIANGHATFTPSTESTQSSYYSIANTYFNNIKNEMTVEACVYASSFPVGGSRIISPRVNETGSSIGFNIGNGNIGYEVNHGGSWKTGSFSKSGTSNSWLHITQTTSNTANVMITYINGSNVGAVSIPGTLADGGGFLIGLGYYGGAKYSAGKVAYLKVYNRSLTESEIKQNFNALRGRFGI